MHLLALFEVNNVVLSCVLATCCFAHRLMVGSVTIQTIYDSFKVMFIFSTCKFQKQVISTQLLSWVAVVRHHFKWVKI